MAPLPAIPGVVKIVAEGTTGSNPWANIFHATYSGGAPTTAALNGIATLLDDAWTAANGITKLQTHDTDLLSITVTDLSSDMGNEGAVFGATPGTNGEDPLPGNVCTLVSWHIGRRYRGGHPRTYFNAGGDGNLVNMSDWNAGYLTEVAAAMVIWQTALETSSSGGCTLTNQCCVSYVDRNVNPIPPYRRAVPLVEVIPAGAFIADSQLASQRRRIGRR